MADQHFPLLLFPAAASLDRDKPPGGGKDPSCPPIDRQRARIGPKFQTLQAAFDARRLQLQQVAPGQNPDLVIVFETIGTIKNFFRAVKLVPGLEWLLESAEDDIAPDDDFHIDGQRDKPLSGRLFLIGSNQAALTQILSLWNRYQANTSVRFEKNLAPWKHVFHQLKDIRYWTVRDRIGDDVRSYWRHRLDTGVDPIRFEIDIWHFASPEKNAQARNEVAALVASLNGRTLSHAHIADIAYHGMLVELPAATIATFLNGAPPELVLSDRIMYFRPKGQSAAPKIDDEIVLLEQAASSILPAGPPVVAMLDGFPIQNHPLLAGRLVVDDPDNWEAEYPAQDRIHGTAMASLIALGDIEAGEQPLSRPIYVRPVLRPDPFQPDPPREVTPNDVLLIDLMHRAIKRICEGDGNQPAAAPSVRIINLSLGDQERPFDRQLSPWARLLDWLAFKYRLLFIVSAGNQVENLTLATPRESLARLPEPERHALALQSLIAQSANRPLLAPAEAINAITIGAQHSDASRIEPYGRYDLFANFGVSPYSCIGYGFRRAIKPELLFPGGRILFREQIVGPAESSTVLPIWNAAATPGHRVAAPLRGNANTTYTRGTSNAAALASRGASRSHEVIEALRAQDPALLPREFDAVLIKALLAHGARWGDLFGRLAAAAPALGDRDDQRKFAARWLGYGPVEIERALSCAEERATMLGFGELRDGQASAFSAPMPPSLAGRVLWKRLTITLSWLSPINPAHQAYRRAKMWISPPAKQFEATRIEGEWRQVQRGTLQHEVLDGDTALAFVDGDRFVCKVNCAADAGELTDAVPFALCVSLEVAPGIGVPIYEEIRDRIQPRVEIQG